MFTTLKQKPHNFLPYLQIPRNCHKKKLCFPYKNKNYTKFYPLSTFSEIEYIWQASNKVIHHFLDSVCRISLFHDNVLFEVNCLRKKVANELMVNTFPLGMEREQFVLISIQWDVDVLIVTKRPQYYVISNLSSF